MSIFHNTPNLENAIFFWESYLALRLHFTSDYDFIKFNGGLKNKIRTPADVDTFMSSKNYQFSALLSTKLKTKQNIFDFILANLVNNPSVWLADLIWDSGYDIYIKWKARQESFTHSYIKDVNFITDYIIDNRISFNTYLKPTSEFPLIIQHHIQRKINIETVCVVEHLLKFLTPADKVFLTNFVYEDSSSLIKNYLPLLIKIQSFDDVKTNRVKDILKNKIEETINILPF